MKLTYAFVLSILVVALCAPRALDAQSKTATPSSTSELLKNVQQVRAPSCDRTCLKDVMTKYLDSLVAPQFLQRDEPLPLSSLDRHCATLLVGQKIFQRPKQIRTKSSFFLADGIETFALQ